MIAAQAVRTSANQTPFKPVGKLKAPTILQYRIGADANVISNRILFSLKPTQNDVDRRPFGYRAHSRAGKTLDFPKSARMPSPRRGGGVVDSSGAG